MNVSFLSLLLFVLLYAPVGDCCGGDGGGGKKKPQPTPTPAPTPDPNDPAKPTPAGQTLPPTAPPRSSSEPDLSKPAKRVTSPDLRTKISGGERTPDISCKASDKACCWENEYSWDTLDYQIGYQFKKELVPYVLKKTRRKVPDEIINGTPFYFIGMQESISNGVEQEAWFKSTCTIPCIDVGSVISVRQIIRTGDVYLEACFIEDGAGSPLLDCGIFTDNPKRDGLIYAKLENLDTVAGKQVVIRASGFMSNDLLVFDDIKYNYTSNECEGLFSTTYVPDYSDYTEATTSQPGKPVVNQVNQSNKVKKADEESCNAVTCNDKKDCMSYSNSDKQLPKQATLHDAWGYRDPSSAGYSAQLISNVITGIDSQEPYYGAYALAGQGGAAKSGDLNLLEDRILRFEFMERAEGLEMKLCVDQDASNCLWTSSPGFTIRDQFWRTASVRLPKGLKKLYWAVENKGPNQGAAAFRNVALYTPKDLNNPKSNAYDKKLC